MYADIRVSQFLCYLDFHLKHTGEHVGQYGEGGNGHMTVVLNIYQQPRTCERYVQDRHRSDHISPLHFAVKYEDNHDATEDARQTWVRQVLLRQYTSLVCRSH